MCIRDRPRGYYEPAGGKGTQTSALIFGAGTVPGTSNQADSWSGTNWTNITGLNTAKKAGPGIGASNTNGLCCGGRLDPGAVTDETETWNGSSWTNINTMNTARRAFSSSGASNTSGLAFSGYSTTVLNVTESWNGTNWTTVAETNVVHYNGGGAGSGNGAGLVFSGSDPGATEIWAFGPQTKTFTAS